MNEHPNPAPPISEQPGITGSLARTKEAVDKIFNKHLCMVVTREGDTITTRYGTRVGNTNDADRHYKDFHFDVCEIVRRMTDAESMKVYDAQVATTTQRKRAEKAEAEIERVNLLLKAAYEQVRVEADRTRVAQAAMDAQRRRAEKAEKALVGARLQACIGAKPPVDSESESKPVPVTEGYIFDMARRLAAVERALEQLGHKPAPWYNPNVQPKHVDCSRRCTEAPPVVEMPPVSSFGCDNNLDFGGQSKP